MQSKKSPRTSLVEHAWKIVLQQIDRGRQRSGKALARQSEVSFLPIEENRICARMVSKGFDGGVHFVELPCVDNWNEEMDRLAYWLAHRLDLFAACLSGEWNEEFLALLDKAGLHLFPDEQYAKQLQWEAKCTCSSQDPICKHVVGVIYKLIWVMESRPLRAIEFVCVDPQNLIDKIHLHAAKLMKKDKNFYEIKELNLSGQTENFFSANILASEQITYSDCETLKDNLRARQLMPEIQTVDLDLKRNIYMT